MPIVFFVDTLSLLYPEGMSKYCNRKCQYGFSLIFPRIGLLVYSFNRDKIR